MGERFLKHPPKSQIERVFWGDQTDSIRYARVPSSLCGSREGPVLLDQFYWTNLAPVLLDQFSTSSTGPILLAYDFFLNF